MTTMQRVLAALCAIGGLWLLVGPGWALLAAGALLWTAPEPRRVSAFAQRTAASVGRRWRWFISDRHRVVVTDMAAAVLLAFVGASVIAGVGVGLVVAAGGAAGTSLLAGWNS
jgi:uncharacterized membrane-anchored protein YitT (DUF2179 family)